MNISSHGFIACDIRYDRYSLSNKRDYFLKILISDVLILKNFPITYWTAHIGYSLNSA